MITPLFQGICVLRFTDITSVYYVGITITNMLYLVLDYETK